MKRKTWLAALLSLAMTLCLASGAFAASAVETEWKTVTLPELNLTVSIPPEYTVYTRNMDSSDEDLALLGVTRDELNAMLESWNYYLDALDFTTMREISVAMMPMEVPDFETYTDETLRMLCEMLKAQFEATGITVPEFDICRTGGVAYMVFRLKTADAAGKEIYGLQYYTAVNNKAINILFKNNNGGDIVDEETDIVRRVVESAVYGDLTE